MTTVRSNLGFLASFLVSLTVWIPALLLRFYIEPLHRGFYAGDVALAFPYYGSTVTTGMYFGIGLGVPPLLILVNEFLEAHQNRHSESILTSWRKKFLFSFSQFNSMFLMGAGITSLLTELGKFLVGRPRPHFLEVCQPTYTFVNCDTVQCARYPVCAICGFIKDTEVPGVCASGFEDNPTRMADAWKSFPSSHASMSAYTMIFAIIYLQCCLNSKWQRHFPTVKPLLQFFLFMWTFFCSLSRITDNKHHATDVFIGWLLGAMVGAWAIYQVLSHKKQFDKPPPSREEETFVVSSHLPPSKTNKHYLDDAPVPYDSYTFPGSHTTPKGSSSSHSSVYQPEPSHAATIF